MMRKRIVKTHRLAVGQEVPDGVDLRVVLHSKLTVNDELLDEHLDVWTVEMDEVN